MQHYATFHATLCNIMQHYVTVRNIMQHWMQHYVTLCNIMTPNKARLRKKEKFTENLQNFYRHLQNFYRNLQTFVCKYGYIKGGEGINERV